MTSKSPSNYYSNDYSTPMDIAPPDKLPSRPQNPTKTELLEKHWFEFLQYLQGQIVSFGAYGASHVEPTESWFWDWYIYAKLEKRDA